MYCTPTDLIAHANRAQMVTELSGDDYGRLPAPQAVVDYFTDGTASAEDLPALQKLKARCQQVVDLAAGDIAGYLALMPDVAPKLPASFLTTCNLDMALFRLFEKLPEDSVIRDLNDQRHAFFNNILSGKAKINRDTTPKGNADTAQTVGEAMVFTPSQLEGY